MSALETNGFPKSSESNMSKMGRPLVMPVEDRCKEIFSAAEKLFGLKGFANVTMAEIAAESGMSKKTLYVLFSDKKALLKSLVSSSFVWSDQILTLEENLTAIAALKRHLNVIAEYVLSERHLKLCRLAIAENYGAEGSADTFYQMGISKSRQSLMDSIDKIPRAQHRLQLDIGLLADMIFGAVIGKKMNDALMTNQILNVDSKLLSDEHKTSLEQQSSPDFEMIAMQITSVVDALFIEIP